MGSFRFSKYDPSAVRCLRERRTRHPGTSCLVWLLVINDREHYRCQQVREQALRVSSTMFTRVFEFLLECSTNVEEFSDAAFPRKKREIHARRLREVSIKL